MAAGKAPKPRRSRPHLPVAEKRRIVEQTLGPGASLRAIADEHGISRNSLRRWRVLYRAGKLAVRPPPRIGTSTAQFLPVTITPSAHRSQRSGPVSTEASRTSIVELTLWAGAMLRIETAALDVDLIRALVAELRR